MASALRDNTVKQLHWDPDYFVKDMELESVPKGDVQVPNKETEGLLICIVRAPLEREKKKGQ